MIQGVLFDLDGTLLDRDRSLQAFLQDQYERIQPLQKIDKQVFIRSFVEWDQKGYVWKDVVYQKLIAAYHLDLSWEALLDDYIQSFQYHCIGFPGLIEMLDYLQDMNVKLGIISNGFGAFQMNNIRGLHIEGYFDEILISEIEGIRKPDMDIFNRALDRLGLTPGQAMFIGDHPSNDVDASVNAGMLGVWKETDGFAKPSQDHLVIKDLIEIKEKRLITASCGGLR